MENARRSSAFTLFGFPVHVRVGFVVFLGLVALVNGTTDPAFGWALAAAMAILTLLHELGHAFAARATGARAEIALDFFYGYASFVPTRALKRWERAGISFAGPAVQIGLSVALLAATGVNPLSLDAIRDADSWQQAVYWAGPVIGLFNLIPVLPFDGGNIALAGFEAVAGKRARSIMVYGSLIATVSALVLLALSPRYQGFVLFAAFPLVAQIQMVGAMRATARFAATSPTTRAAAERRAWTAGEVDQFRGGVVASPWYEASLLLAAGRDRDARGRMAQAFAAGEPGRWVQPDGAAPASLAALVDLLPEPLPSGNAQIEWSLADVLCTLGEYDRAAHYAARSFSRHRTQALALIVARAAAALGDASTMRAWLGQLPAAAPPTHLERSVHGPRLFAAPELAPFLNDPAVAAITGRP
jgi:Zn-dependent protease